MGKRFTRVDIAFVRIDAWASRRFQIGGEILCAVVEPGSALGVGTAATADIDLAA